MSPERETTFAILLTVIIALSSSCGLIVLHNSYRDTSRYEVGTCLREPEYEGLHKNLGSWWLIVDKSERTYVVCQGRGGVNRWYQCAAASPSTINQTHLYVPASCPGWPIDDNRGVYRGVF